MTISIKKHEIVSKLDVKRVEKLIEDEKKETIKEILLQNEKEVGMVETVGESEEDHLYIVKTPLKLEREDIVGLVTKSHTLVKSESLISYDLQLNILDKLEECDDATIKETKTIV